MSPGDLVLLKAESLSEPTDRIGLILYELKGLNYEKQSFRTFMVLVASRTINFHDYELELLRPEG